MGINLHQKYFLNNKYFELQEGKIFVKNGGLKENIEFSIRFEDLGFDVYKKKDKTKNFGGYILVIFFLLGLSLVITSIAGNESIKQIFMSIGYSLFLGVTSILAFKSPSRDLVFLTGGTKNLELFRRSPTEKHVEEFIEEIHKQMRNYFKIKYAFVVIKVPFEIELNRLKWLKEIKAITEIEYTELIKGARNNSNTVGF
jgi:hypothetical protein